MKKISTPLILAAGFLIIGYANQERIVLNLMSYVAEKNFSSSILKDLPDGLHVVLCGAGSPLPDPKRAGPCTAVIAGKQIYIIDSGSGSSKNLTLFNIPQGEINGVLLTHFHSDHIDGLGELMLQRWVNGTNTDALAIYGPSGVEQVVEGFNMAYAQDDVYRVSHHGAETIIPEGNGGIAIPFELPAKGKLVTVLEKDGLRISSLQVNHAPVAPAVGYRFDYKGRSLVISGDTAKSSNLQALSQGVDLLIHEALNNEMVANITAAAKKQSRPRMEKITFDIHDYHTSPVEAAEIAEEANIGHLLYTHIVPPLPFSFMEKTFTKGVDEVYSGGVTVGSDGTKISLLANEKSIKVSKVGSFISP